MKLKSYFKKNKDVLLAYRFGSSVTNPAQAKDVDIAILLDKESFEKRKTLSLELEIASECIKILKLPSLGCVDIIFLNNATSLLKYEVISKGELIYEKDAETRINFETQSLIKFYDFEPLRKLFWESTRKRIREKRFGE